MKLAVDLKILESIVSPRFSGKTVGQIINDILPMIFILAGFLVLGYLVMGGFQVLTSQGDPKAVAAGKEKITQALIGFIIIFTAFWIVQIVARILNLQGIISVFG